MPGIAFPEGPELFVSRTQARKSILLRRVLAIIYISGGLSALLAIAAKFIVTPLFEQLTEARQSYATLARKLLEKNISKLTSMVSVVPTVKRLDSLKTVMYDSQTQTTDLIRGIRTGKENHSVETEIDSCKKTNLALAQAKTEAANKPFSELHDSLDQMLTYIHQLTYKLDGAGKTKDIIGDLRKEIRQTKGLLLNS